MKRRPWYCQSKMKFRSTRLCEIGQDDSIWAKTKGRAAEQNCGINFPLEYQRAVIKNTNSGAKMLEFKLEFQHGLFFFFSVLEQVRTL